MFGVSQWSSRMWPAVMGLATLLAAGIAAAEPPAAPDSGDIRRALIFTGHYSALERGAPDALLRKAIQSWQSANEMTVTEDLPPDATNTLLADGLKQRYAVGWAMLRDKAVGLELGIPTKLVKFTGTHPTNSTLEYGFDGEIDYKLFVRYGDYNCGTMNTFYSRSVAAMRPAFAARQDDWFALASSVNGKVEYWKAICRPSAIALATISLTAEQFAKHGVLVTAMADSFTLGRHFNSTAVPHPKIDAPLPRPADYKDGETARAPKLAAAELPPNVDGTGKIAALRVAARTGAELRTEQVFEQAGAAVYMVKAGDRQGSAVAIGETRTADQLPRRGGHDEGHPGARSHRDRGRPGVEERRGRSLRAADRHPASQMGTRPALRQYPGRRARLHHRHAARLRAYGRGGYRFVQAHPRGPALVQTSAPVSPGSSGGGLFDGEGQLLGITTFLIRDAQNLNFAIAADEYAK